MNKAFFLLLFLAFPATEGLADDGFTPTLASATLSGPVHTVTLRESSGDGLAFLVFTSEYDRRGLKIREEAYERELSVGQTLFHHNGGHLTSSESSIGMRWTYRWNPAGKLEKEEIFRFDKLIRTLSHKWDDQGRLLRREDRGPDGKLERTEIHIYDGSKEELRAFGADGVETSRHIFIRDSQGRLIERQDWSRDGILLSRDTFENDSWGQLKKRTRFDGKGKILESTGFVYVYDDHHNWIEKRDFPHSAASTAPWLFLREITYYE